MKVSTVAAGLIAAAFIAFSPAAIPAFAKDAAEKAEHEQLKAREKAEHDREKAAKKAAKDDCDPLLGEECAVLPY